MLKPLELESYSTKSNSVQRVPDVRSRASQRLAKWVL